MLDDLLKPELTIVFCGTAAGLRSAALAQYYAGPGNQFWKVLAQVGLTPRQLLPHQYLLLSQYGIGLTDVVKGQAGNDSEITFQSNDGRELREKIARFQPRYLCFNGKRAAKAYFGTATVTYGIQPGTIGATKLFVAPSTSGAARGHWDVSVWRQLAVLARSTS
jgi:double-stranded uracil-DNA glycosylase